MLLVVVFALVCFGYAAFEICNGLSSTTWPATPAHIEELTLRKYTDKYSGEEQEIPILRYRYSVGGKSFSCDRIEFGGVAINKTPCWPSIKHRNLLARCKGTDIVAYYNPSMPAIACLEPGVNWSTPVAAMLLAGSCILKNLRDSHKRSKLQDKSGIGENQQ